ncbi:MFS general substrate transporter [Sporormia fimetaria CBS 119925]|uniref:MFS general substrate transporter n=1 Tax=Sporormia fimetaria CBS 119925 TaxID=1340428 RepID=A0A6A6VHL3_9PLEO|nr:MFS general substrate transporter [Sporormia fimetaria CBS 119925]
MAYIRNVGSRPRAVAATSSSMMPSVTQTRLHIIVLGLWISLFVAAMDTSILSTALIRISSDFRSLGSATWLVTSYLLTYNTFIMISAKLSDVFGLKLVMIVCSIFFLVFSLACGVAQTMNQLIVLRAFQGIGGSGLYSLVFVAIMKLITPEKVAFYSGIISSVFAVANCLGPVLGGVITDQSTWRWIFFINGPIVGTALIILWFSMPGLKDGKSIRDRMEGFDVVGGILSVCWPIPLIFALQEGGIHYGWNSPVIIATLVAGVVALLIFGFYEGWISYRTAIDAIFPIRFVTNPNMALLLGSMFLLGMPFVATIIQLPQRFQAVNYKSAERAGILLLPLTLMTPVGSMFGALLMGRKICAEYLLIFASAIVSIGVGLLGTLPLGVDIWPGTYGYQVIVGFGLGAASPVFYFLLHTTVEPKQIAVGTGALNMLRSLGGCVAIAICSALHNSTLRSRLPEVLSPEQVSRIEDSREFIAMLPPRLQKEVGEVFAESYNRQFQVLLGCACASLLVAIALAVVRKRNGLLGRLPELEAMRGAGTHGHAVELESTSESQPSAGSRVEAQEKMSGRVSEVELIGGGHTPTTASPPGSTRDGKII